MTKSYRDIDIYKLAHELGVTLHKFSLKLPKHELYETGSQLRRASKSISSNIVEGYGRRRYKAEFIRFLIFAQASSDETTEWLEYLRDIYEDFKEETDQLLSMTNVLGKKINRFIQAVESKHKV